MKTCLLFVYGLLQPGFQPPHSIRKQEQDRVRGKLYCLGHYPGAMEVGTAKETFEGWVLEIDEEELHVLDEFEDVTSGQQYRRIQTTTLAGTNVWIYEYIGPLPTTPMLERWPTES